MRPKELLIQLMISFLILGSVSAQKLSLEGITSIKVSFNNPENEIPVSAKIFHSFPAWDITEISDTISVTKKQIWLRCPVRTLQTGYITIQNTEHQLLMIPGDTINISLSGASEAPKRYYCLFSYHPMLFQEIKN